MANERIATLEALLRRVLETAPRCFNRDCDKAAVYAMPTAVIGDSILVCEEHRTCDKNEFDEKTVELRWTKLHREIRQALGERART